MPADAPERPMPLSGACLWETNVFAVLWLRYHAEANDAASPGTGFTGLWSDGSQFLAFFILILCSALTPVIRGRGRMRRRARADLCGGGQQRGRN